MGWSGPVLVTQQHSPSASPAQPGNREPMAEKPETTGKSVAFGPSIGTAQGNTTFTDQLVTMSTAKHKKQKIVCPFSAADYISVFFFLLYNMK